MSIDYCTKRLQKRVCERYQIISKEEQERKTDNVSMNSIEISLKIKNIGWLSKEKNIIK